MSIPASVGLYVRWENGSYSDPTYTSSTPDKPNSHAWTGNGTGYSLATDSDSPWNGQKCAFVTDTGNSYWSTSVTSSEVAASSGRILIESQQTTGGLRFNFLMEATEWWDGQIYVREISGGTMEVSYRWQSNQATVNLGTYPSGAFVVEIIYDSSNGTAANRLRARTWTLGGSPGSFTDTGSSTSSGSSDQFLTIKLGDSSSGVDAQFGRIIVSSDIAEDLSAVSEDSLSVYAYQ